jgi:hypothetical protein
MVFLLPASPVHAAGPTVTLSTIKSGALTATTTGTPQSTIVITGTGFNPASAITITTTVGTTTVSWLSLTTGKGVSTTTPAVDSLVVAGDLTTTAAGNFQVEVLVPNLPAGAQTITVSDGVNTGTATFTITPSIAITWGVTTNYGFPEETVTPTITVYGFGSGESVSVAETVFAATSFSCTTGAAVGTYGTCVENAAATVVADTTGGAHTVTATGATTGLTATTSYTVNPWVAFYNSAGGATTFSFIGTAPTSLLVEGHGFAAGTIAANSITIGGTATNHGAITVGSAGNFFGQVVSPSANVPYGLVSAVIQGTTFSFANGNIAINVVIGGANKWGGALISSVIGTASTSTGVASLSGSTFLPGTPASGASTTSPAPQQNEIGLFGYGFVPHEIADGGVLTAAVPTGAAYSTALTFIAGNGGVGGLSGAAMPDANGAFFATALLGETPWSLTATPTTAASYTQTVSQAASSPANVLSPSFGITPWIDPSSIVITPTNSQLTPTVDYTDSISVTVHGFGSTDTVTIKIGGTALVTGGSIAVGTTGEGITATGEVPDLAGGLQTITATGSVSGATATAVGAVTYDPTVNSAAGVSALSINQGGAGQTTVLRTGTDYGVHGLAANTAYTIVWNAISGSLVLGTFTSTATGGIPIPGVQVTIPSDSSGVHILDIEASSGASAIFGNLVAGQIIPTESIAPADFPNSVYTSAYGDLLFSNVALLSASPSVATIGSAETITGTGLAAGGSYVIALGNGAGTVSETAPALATFVATSSGAVPAGTMITLGDTPTGIETGTVEYFSIQTAAHYGTSTVSDAYAEFVLAASASLNMTSAPVGHAIVLTAHALNPGAVYDIVFNYVQSSFQSTSFTGTTVGVIAPNSVGAGSATFDVPAGAATGPTVVQLVVSTAAGNGDVKGTAILNTPLSINVGSVNTGTCNTTSCVSATGQPTQTTQGSYTGVSTAFTNNSNAPVTGFVYAVVHNALGQTVDISTATITAPAGGSVTAFNALFGLPPGTYSVTIFVTSSSGTAISSTTTASVTIS